jgi:hypothetical protein
MSCNMQLKNKNHNTCQQNFFKSQMDNSVIEMCKPLTYTPFVNGSLYL